MKIVLLCLFLLIINSGLSAQLHVSEAGLDICSRHIWRGGALGTAPAFEPSVTVAGGRFSLNFWASVTPNNSYSEIDLIPAWQLRNFQLTFFDYYNPVPGERNRYFRFWKEEGRHSLELAIDNYAVTKHRLRWFAGTFLLGDRSDETRRPLFSTYIEFKYPFVVFGIEGEPVLGITPLRGYYADCTALINSGLKLGKELEITRSISMPFSIAYTYNPYKGKSYLVFSTGVFFSRPE